MKRRTPDYLFRTTCEVRPDGKRKRNVYYAMFRCECGKIFEARERNVRHGQTHSCGCIKKHPDFWTPRLNNLIKYRESKGYSVKRGEV